MKNKTKKIKTTFQGWNTTDEDEIIVRKNRALKEDFIINNLKRKNNIFSSYEVKSKNSVYLVELRSFGENINSCDCPDLEVNKLGTCKHIEAVKLLYPDEALKNKKIEIFLDSVVDKIKILFPHGSKKRSLLRDTLEPFFSENKELLSEPTISYLALQRQINKLDNIYKNKINISAMIQPWLKTKKFELEKLENKKIFLADYKNAKRSFDFLKYPLFDYQKEGVLHLAFNERALLADDMGLGKTIQAIGACILLKNLQKVKKVLIISPASLKSEWQEQIKKFTQEVSIFIYGNKQKRDEKYHEKSFFYLANYEQILYDKDIINNVLQPDIIILDEAQRIKNWQTKTANSIKKLHSRYAFVLSGTPIENRIDEIYSIVQFLNPKIFGSLFRFNRDFYKLDSKGIAVGYKNMNLLHERLKPIMLRRKKNDVEGELPPRSIKTYFVQMEKSQQDRYDEYETMVSRLASRAKKYPLSFDEMKKLQLGLSCMRILCDSAYILDQKITSSPKIDEIVPIIEELLEEKDRKIIIFSEWEKMLQLLDKTLQTKEIIRAWHTGSFNQIQRRQEIKKFKEDENCNIFLSTDSGSVGLNLQVANVVINLDMPWNPAKLEHGIARAWRKHQTRGVQVINLITEDRLEHRIVEIVKQKQFLSDNILDGLGEDELDLPSSRKEFLEDIDKIINENKLDTNQQSTKENIKNFSDDLVSILNDRVEMVSKNDKSNTVFVVVDKKDETIESKIDKIYKDNISSCKIQILHSSQYRLLQQLAKQGLIEIKQDLNILYKSNETSQKLDDKTLIKAKELFDIAKRKYEMAELLKGGGFVDESVPIFEEMKIKAFEVFKLLEEDSHNYKDLNAQDIYKHLKYFLKSI